MYNFKFNFDKQDYININQLLMKNSKSFKTAVTLLKFSVPVFAAVMPLLYQKDFNILTVLISVTIAIAWLMWFPRFFKNSTSKKLSRKIDEINDQSLYQERNIKVDDTGFHGNISRGIDYLGFDKVTKIKEDDGYVFVYTSKIHAFVIPKSVVKNIEGFTNYVNSRIGTKQL